MVGTNSLVCVGSKRKNTCVAHTKLFFPSFLTNYSYRFTCGNMTFQEAYLKTGRVLCITISAKTTRSPPVVLNHITTPNVIIASAVVASSSLPTILTPFCLRRKNAKGEIEILKVEFWDGTIDQVIFLLSYFKRENNM